MLNYKIQIFKNIKPTIILWVVGYFCLAEASAQVDSLNYLISTGDSLRKAKSYDASDSIYRIAKRKAKSEKLWDKWFSATNGMRRIAQEQNNFSNYIDSLILYKSEIPDSSSKAQGYLNYFTGSFCSKEGRQTEAIKFYKAALPYFKKAKINNGYCSSINNISNNYSRIGDNQSALKYVEEGLKFLNSLPDASDYKNFNKYNSNFNTLKGFYLIHNQEYLKAISYFEGLLNSENENENENLIFSVLAQAHIRNGTLAEAKVYLDKVAAQMTPDDERDFYAYSSEYAVKNDDINKAIDFQRRVLLYTSKDRNRRTHTRELARYADLLYQGEQYKEALKYAHQAIYNLRPEIDSNNLYQVPELVGPPEIHLISAYYTKAKCHNLNFLQNNKVQDKEAVSNNYNLIFQMFDDLKQNIYGNESNYRLGGISQNMYQDAIRYYLDSYDSSQKIEDYNKAFRIAQLANSFVLKNSISERQSLEYAQVPKDLANDYLQLKSKLSEAYVEGESLILEDQEEFETLSSQIQIDYPGFTSYNSNTLIDITKLQAQLAYDEILLKYYYFDKTLTVFSVSQQQINHYTIELNKEDLEKIEAFNSAIINTQSNSDPSLEEEFCKNSYAIYSIIFSPLEKKSEFSRKQKIYIIPDGPIKNISFNALLHKESNSWAEASDFLISKYTFRYLYYASQLSDTRGETLNDNNFVGFGIKYQDEYLKEIIDNYYENEDTIYTDGIRSASLSVLNHAIAEVQACAQLIGGIPIIEAEATQQSIIDNIKKSKIAHFAVHALVDKDNFNNSHILLLNSEKEQREFGYVDILNLNLDCELVVLSACQTGIGQNIVGEGLMSLSRAFVQSGGQSSLGSYWNAPDKSTRIIMTLFYENLKKGLTKSEAIKAAQLEYLTNDNISSPAIRAPYYWAGWTLYGKDGTIEFNKKPRLVPLLILGFVSLLLLLLFRLKFYTKKKPTKLKKV